MPTAKQIADHDRKVAENEAKANAPAEGGGFGSVSDFGQGTFRGIANLAPLAADAAQFAGVGRGGDNTRLALEQSPLLQRPDTFMGRAGERFGSGAPFLAMGGPIAGQGPKAALGFIASEVIETGAGQAAEDLGVGGTGQFLIEMGFGAGINPNIGRFAKSARTRTNKNVKKLADKLGVSERQVLRVADFHKHNDFDIDPTTGLPDLDTPRKRLKESVEIFPDPNERVSTRQALSKVSDQGLEDAPSRVAARELAMARPGSDDIFARRLGGRKNAVLRMLDAEFEELSPGGTFGTAKEAFDAHIKLSKDLADTAWDGVDLASMPMVSTARLKKAAKATVTRVGVDNREQFPPEIKKILALPDEIPASRLQSLRSGSLLAHRVKSNPFAESGAAVQARHMGPILDALTKEVDELPTSGSAAYKAAREATAKHYELFSPNSVAIRAMQEIEDGPKVIQRIIGNANSGAEARKLIRALEQTPGGADGFRQAVIEDLTQFGIANKSAGSMLKRLSSKKGFYMETLGEQRYGQLLKVVKKFRSASVGGAGTAGGLERAGSALGRLARGIAATASGGPGVTEIGEVVAYAGSLVERRLLSKDVIREFMLDPETALILLNAPSKETLPIWTATFDMFMARALTRQSLASTGAAAARSFTPDRQDFLESQPQVNSPLPEQR